MDGHRILRLDGLRFVAALMVVFFHYAFRGSAAGVIPALDLPSWLSGLAAYGYLGVNLFFMISGFVIAYSAEGRTPMDFGIARFARLYPSYAAAMALTFIVTLLFGAPEFTASFSQFLANLTMLAPAFGQDLMDGAYWSIVLEVIFYSWVFLFMLTGHFRKDCERIILIWLTLSLYNEFFFEIKGLRFFFLTEFAGFFAAGILIYRIRSGVAEIGTYALLALSLAVSLVTTSNGLKVIEDNYRMDYPDQFVSLLVVTLYALFYAASGDGPSRIPARYVAAAGALTYPLYLVHQHLGYIAISRLHGAVGDTALVMLVIAAVLSLAFLIRLAVDKPMVPLLRRVLTKRIGVLAKNAPLIGRYLTRRDVFEA